MNPTEIAHSQYSAKELRLLEIMIDEAVGCINRAEDEVRRKREVLASIQAQFDIDSKILNQVIAIRRRNTFVDVVETHQATQELYTSLFKQPTKETENET